MASRVDALHSPLCPWNTNMTLTREQIEQIERIAVPPNAADGLADHGTIDRKFLSELAALALRGLDATKAVDEIKSLTSDLMANNTVAFNDGIEEAAKEAERWGDTGVSAAYIIRTKKRTP